jgi:hypothetical protein
VVGIVGPFSTGVYYVVALNNVGGTTASVIMNVTEIPVNVFYLHSSLPSPIGIADYEVINVSSKLDGEVIKYNEAIGHASIYNISAYNSTFPIPNGASLLLNSVLQVNTPDRTYQFWLQNEVDFMTAYDSY